MEILSRWIKKKEREEKRNEREERRKDTRKGRVERKKKKRGEKKRRVSLPFVESSCHEREQHRVRDESFLSRNPPSVRGEETVMSAIREPRVPQGAPTVTREDESLHSWSGKLKDNREDDIFVYKKKERKERKRKTHLDSIRNFREMKLQSWKRSFFSFFFSTRSSVLASR